MTAIMHDPAPRRSRFTPSSNLPHQHAHALACRECIPELLLGCMSEGPSVENSATLADSGPISANTDINVSTAYRGQQNQAGMRYYIV